MAVIYRLFGAGMNYFGSTKQRLYERKSTHKSQHKTWKKNGGFKCSSYDILDACEDWDIEIVDVLPEDSTKEEILIKEKWWIDNNECVNKQSPIRTEEDHREYQRLWAEKNRRAKGVQPKNPNYDDKKCKAEWAKKKRANMTPEEKEAFLKHRRETRPEQTEEQKQKARERAKKQREKKKAEE
jgi:hypothetical protein